MTQVMNLGTNPETVGYSRKAYAVSIKGLIAHTMDVLFKPEPKTNVKYAANLSSHLQRDIGLNR